MQSLPSGTTSPKSTAVTVLPRSPRVLSCVLCQQRKIKCDKGSPCSNCDKVGAICTPSTPAPVRKSRRTNRDLRERLAKCEALLKQHEISSAASESAASTSRSTNYATPTSDSTLSPNQCTPFADDDHDFPLWMPKGKVIVENGSVNYVDNFPWATIQNQLQSMRQILDDEEQSATDSDMTPPREELTVSFNDASTTTLEDVIPTPVQIFKLWQVFLERVNPLTKLIHVPSLQPLVVEASTDHSSLPQNAQALLFSIYAVSTKAMTEQESAQVLKMPREDGILRFASGAKMALARAKFMEKYDLMTLQTLVLYLLSLHGRISRHETWVLSGIQIRMAQKLGLHRDGERLNLSPFEAEMRRRLWWQILMSDTKYAIASGFHEPFLTWNYDTKVPHNVNDADLFPNFMEPIRPRESPTEMGFYLILCEMCRFIIENRITDFQTLALGQIANGKKTPSASDMCKELIQIFDIKLQDIEDKYIDPSAGPLHLLASKFRHVLTAELLCIMTPIQELPEWGTEIFNAEDNVFRICLIHFENHVAISDEMAGTNFEWFLKLHFETDAILYIAGQLQTRTLGSLVDRSWSLLDHAYHVQPELWDMSRKENVEIGISILKAWRVRERALFNIGLPYDTSAIVLKLKTIVPQSSPSPAPPPPQVQAEAALETDWLVDQLSNYMIDTSNLMPSGHHDHF
ncbi:fungal-specific transcription factor domain-containing protein [Dactylonectria estremocensis]|uniref:Fungal-specific transcription factor domain-containing protein n=1 Tax=Dactylonectria estremocensis TaxID=1079267 RepID=A0A9P9E525_9HYPO|nr:fungal-specific transcription factor domain-containing protein [Dactylonectria estremocensis]